MPQPPPSIVLLPGHMCDERLWLGGDGVIANQLRAREAAAVRNADLSLDDSIAAMATQTLNAIPGGLVPVGFSMGAIVAVEMWVQAPQRIAALALIGFNARADLPERAADRPSKQAEARHGGLARILTELKPYFVTEANRTNSRLLALLLEMGMDLGPDVFIRQSEALRTRRDYRSTLEQITVPVLLGCGEHDALCPPDWHSSWASMVPDASLFVVPNAAHMLPLEDPQSLARHLDTWLLAKRILDRPAAHRSC